MTDFDPEAFATELCGHPHPENKGRIWFMERLTAALDAARKDGHRAGLERFAVILDNIAEAHAADVLSRPSGISHAVAVLMRDDARDFAEAARQLGSHP